ncbi:MAG: DUF1127 domain-containing protein [Rhizobiaceae bacterium]
MIDTIDAIHEQARTASGKLATFVRRLPHGETLLERLTAVLDAWVDRRRSRIALSRLNDDQLADIGLTRGRARSEASRPFWDSGFRFPDDNRS